MATPETMTAMELKLKTNLEQFMFDPHVEATWDAITQSYYDMLNGDVSLEDFAVKCDSINNTEERVARGELWVDVAIKHNGDEGFTYYPLRVSPTPVAPEETTDVEGDSN